MDCVGISLLVLMAAFGVSKAKECYACTTLENSGCGEDFDEGAIKKINCLTGGCTKTKQGDLIVRNCGIGLVEDQCTDQGDVRLCNCRSNLCNKGMSRTVPMVTILATIIAGVVCRFL